MAQTKHLFFLVFVSCFFATFSFFKVDTENTLQQIERSPSRGISSEDDPTVVLAENLNSEDSRNQILEDRTGRFTGENSRQALRNHSDTVDRAIDMATGLVENFNSCPSDVDPLELCRLPKTFIPAELYDKCCRGSQCLRVNKQCSRGSQCCSGMCVDGFCAANSTNKLYSNEVCTKNSDCFSNECDYKPNSLTVKICYGDNRTNFCSRVSQSCKLNRHCCSNSCSQNRCIGSAREKAPIGYPCAADHSECLSNYCNLQTKRCE